MIVAKWALRVLVAVVAFLATTAGVLLLAGWTEWAPPRLPDAAVPLFVLAVLGAPTAVAVWTWRTLARRWRFAKHPSGQQFRRRLAWFVVAGCVLTAVVGGPATQSQRTAWAVAEYKHLKASGSPRVWDAHPRIRTYVAVPLAPCLVLSYHEYQLDGQYGFGGFELALWYGVGVKSLGALPLWVS